MITLTVGESSLSKRIIGTLWQIIQIIDKYQAIRSQLVQLLMQNLHQVQDTASVPSGFTEILGSVLQDAVAYGLYRQVYVEYFGKHGAPAVTEMALVHVTDAITIKALAAATIIAR